MKPEPRGYSLLISAMTFFDYIRDVWIAKRNTVVIIIKNRRKFHNAGQAKRIFTCPDCKK
jgi:hypothetical protein